MILEPKSSEPVHKLLTDLNNRGTAVAVLPYNHSSNRGQQNCHYQFITPNFITYPQKDREKAGTVISSRFISFILSDRAAGLQEQSFSEMQYQFSLKKKNFQAGAAELHKYTDHSIFTLTAKAR